MSERQREVLEALGALTEKGNFVRPMDLGGRDGSHHSKTLRGLVTDGLAERQPRDTLANFLRGYGLDSPRARSWLYRITPAGLQALGR